MTEFRPILERAVALKGSDVEVRALLPKSKTEAQLAKIPDDRWLAQMSRHIFSAGFVWRVIESKWAGFEEAFHGFDIEKNANLKIQDLEKLAQDTRIVRNPQKIATVPRNARMVRNTSEEHGSFGKFIAAWPAESTVELFAWLKDHGSRLGGMSSQYFLRNMGKDTFMLTPDVNKALIDNQVIARAPSSISAREEVQKAFNQWHKETGLQYCQLSKILACSVP